MSCSHMSTQYETSLALLMKKSQEVDGAAEASGGGVVQVLNQIIKLRKRVGGQTLPSPTVP